MSNSLFKPPEDAAAITFMIRGEPGSGKTRFALSANKIAGRVAYVGNDRGAKFYHADPDIGGFLQVETTDIKMVRQAVAELKADAGASFGAAVVDTVTGVWDSEQAEYERQDDNGEKYIPMRAWRPLREGHERLLRDLQALPLHVFLICEEKPIYSKVGTGKKVELVEVGTKEDSDKKDSYVSDVRLRFYLENKKFCCEVLKDRTGTFKMGHKIVDPTPDMWIKAKAKQAAVPAAKNGNGHTEPTDDAIGAELKASILINRIDEIANAFEWKAWGKKHTAEIKALEIKALIDKVRDAYKAKFMEFNEPSESEGA